MIEHQLVLFDYATLDLETRVIVQQRTVEIKTLMKRAAQDIIEIGQKLIEVKEKLGHGNFGQWLKVEFGFTDRTARNFMQVAETFKSEIISDLVSPTILTLLAAPSIPEFARGEVISRIENGETITISTAKEIIGWHREQIKQEAPEILTFDEWVSQPVKPFEVEDLPAPEPALLQPQSMSLLTSSLNDSWRTPSKYIEAARLVLGGIDLDPASSAIANETVRAKHFLTKEDNSLNHSWFGTVWINPPYGKTNNQSNQGLFAQKLLEEYELGHVEAGIILVNLYFGYGWFAPLRGLPLCLADHRISFIDPSTDEEGDEAKASSVFIYVGKDPTKFYNNFKQFGYCGQLSNK